MTWALFYHEDNEYNYLDELKGEWSDEEVRQVAQEIKTILWRDRLPERINKSSVERLMQCIGDNEEVRNKVKEFLPLPIREAL